MVILSIESSHDDTAISILNKLEVIHNFKISQAELFANYGGTIPELASREHVDNFYFLIEEIKKHFDISKIDVVAYTSHPGLLGPLHIGFLVASAISISLKKKLIPINHLEGHIFSPFLHYEKEKEKEIKYPFLSLVVSGGHSQIYLFKSKNNYKILGTTLDDALGEAFDKVARILDLGFPGGPIIDKIFNNYNSNEILKLTEPKTQNELDFSFSGYKTQVINLKNKGINEEKIAFSFQKQTIDYVIGKFKKAINKYHPKSIILAGGVSANSYLRKEFLKLSNNALIPAQEFSTDNAAMIAARAYILLSNKS